jgi:predicted esterase
VSPPTPPAADGGNAVLPSTPAADGGASSPPPSAAGAGGDGAFDGDAGAIDPSDLSPHPTRVPSVNGSCPKLTANGRYTFRDGTGRSLSVQIYIAVDARQKPAPGGPLILYFHGIGSTPSEVVSAFTQASIDTVVAQGGVVASFESTVCVSCLLDDQQVIWYEQDAPVVDQVVACALAQARVDPRRIHALGFSAGAMYTIYLALARADYLASVMSYSGGLSDQSIMSQDPRNHVPALLSYGRMDLDVVVINFAAQSIAWYDQYHPLGYYSLMCDHGGSHMIAPELAPLGLRFFLDHPYRVSPEPYAASIPSVYPSYCHDAPPNR